jgi:hypothetical protein
MCEADLLKPDDKQCSIVAVFDDNSDKTFQELMEELLKLKLMSGKCN